MHHTHVYAHTHTHAHTHTYTHAHTYTHMHAHINTHTHKAHKRAHGLEWETQNDLVIKTLIEQLPNIQYGSAQYFLMNYLHNT